MTPQMSRADTPEAIGKFKSELLALHGALGSPNYVRLAEQSGIARTYIQTLFARHDMVGNWSKVSKVVEAMHGDMTYFYSLWDAANQASKVRPNHSTMVAELLKRVETLEAEINRINERLAKFDG